MTATAGFGVEAAFRYEPDEALVSVRGELDLQTAWDFAAVLDAGTRGRSLVVLDLAELEFCAAAGLRVIERLARRLNASGGCVVLRAAPPVVKQMLAVTGIDELVDIEPAMEPASHDLPAELEAVLAPLIRDRAVDTIFAAASRLARAVSGAAAASITMQRRDRLETVSSTHDIALNLDETQYANGVGPCVTAATTGHPVEVSGDDDTAGWPALRRAAEQAGIQAVLSTPLVSADGPVGAINLYALHAGFADADRELVWLVAREMTALAETALDSTPVLPRIHGALASRDVIAIAQGILMERSGAPADEGYTILRRDSQATATPLRDIAARVRDSASDPSTSAGFERDEP